ncbi:unnamed protein product [Mesocestoides corti]|uniref:Uncharacterized protein n=1 Tax=Mesocestoides corti TaxID=53468 RepID=A0A0R3UE29_MESCO|nr:unnamed protein product [Mesocestoides corti]
MGEQRWALPLHAHRPPVTDQYIIACTGLVSGHSGTPSDISPHFPLFPITIYLNSAVTVETSFKPTCLCPCRGGDEIVRRGPGSL